MKSEIPQRLADNLKSVRQKISDAAGRAGRDATEVTLVAVTKYVDVEMTAALLRAGCHHLGESRPQVLWDKSATISDAGNSDEVRWHMIGHVQRNKVDRTLPIVEMIHSVDSDRLLEAVEASARKQMLGPVSILLEVNVSEDASKHGWRPDEMSAVLKSCDRYSNVQVVGLMTMASRTRLGDLARKDYSRLRELRDELRAHCPANVSLDHLSMGMSGDFEIAIEEGATIVRIGTALFEGCLG